MRSGGNTSNNRLVVNNAGKNKFLHESACSLNTAGVETLQRDTQSMRTFDEGVKADKTPGSTQNFIRTAGNLRDHIKQARDTPMAESLST